MEHCKLVWLAPLKTIIQEIVHWIRLLMNLQHIVWERIKLTYRPVLGLDALCPSLVSLLKLLVSFQETKVSDNAKWFGYAKWTSSKYCSPWIDKHLKLRPCELGRIVHKKFLLGRWACTEWNCLGTQDRLRFDGCHDELVIRALKGALESSLREMGRTQRNAIPEWYINSGFGGVSMQL